MTSQEKDEHILEAIGRSRIIIRNGAIVEIGESKITECPLAKRFAYPVPKITQEAVKANIEHRMKAFGMCTTRRDVIDTREFVGFGATELLGFASHVGLIDAAVLACDGAGTVIAKKPALIQGVGGRMSGLVSTSPIKEVIQRIEENGGIVVDKIHAALDQFSGVKRAYEEGFKKVAVTVARPEVAVRIRKEYPDAIIFGVHVTGLTEDEAESMVAVADLMTACASKTVRQIAGKKALLQAGVSVPIFAITNLGKEIIIEKIRQTNEQVLIKPTQLPALGEKQPDPLV
ncbi:methanogenesis marker 8 protein [Methanoregula sp.]|jgi:putative methanogenesis marker protein 8|uniref:methanogenesis marker 8 protein n=1 Tax=Methanoregula sp. TaxID=2052170 RepID=UPI003C1722F8